MAFYASRIISNYNCKFTFEKPQHFNVEYDQNRIWNAKK